MQKVYVINVDFDSLHVTDPWTMPLLNVANKILKKNH